MGKKERRKDHSPTPDAQPAKRKKRSTSPEVRRAKLKTATTASEVRAKKSKVVNLKHAAGKSSGVVNKLIHDWTVASENEHLK